MTQEIELKFAVAGEAEFDALLRHLDLPAREFHSTAVQSNHFFDTQTFDLQESGQVLRLREERGRYLLTFKGSQEDRTDDGVATERFEYEVSLAPNLAIDVLRGSISPRDAFAKRAGTRYPEAVERLDASLGRSELHYVGQFENQRTRLEPVPFEIDGRSVPLSLELDRTRFDTERTEYEIEVELTADLHPAAAEEAVAGLLADAGVTWRAAPSKAARFFAAIRGL